MSEPTGDEFGGFFAGQQSTAGDLYNLLSEWLSVTRDLGRSCSPGTVAAEYFEAREQALEDVRDHIEREYIA